MKLLKILFEVEQSEFYGSNYLYRLQPYIDAADGDLPQYAVNFSEFNKWGINPRGGYFPQGIYFYFLTPKCAGYGATGTGFASDRPWANIAKLDLDRFVILGGDRTFNPSDLNQAIEKLKVRYKDLVPKDDEVIKTFDIGAYSSAGEEWIHLVNVLTTMEKNKVGGFNKLLFVAGYYGILDTNGSFLPIESCQGVQTWPGGAEYIESIPTPKSHNYRRNIPKEGERFQNIIKRFKNERNGGMDISEQEFSQIMGNIPKDISGSERRDARMDLLGWLFRKADFSRNDLYNAWSIQQYLEDYGEHLFDDLRVNPTVPKEFWEKLTNSRDEDVRLTARDKLKK